MKRIARGLAAIGVTAALAGAGALTAPMAGAATVVQPKQSVKAFSWNGYTGMIAPKGYAPGGTQTLSKRVTVKKAGKVVASDRLRYWAKAGNYKAITTVKYRTRTSYTAYRNVTVDWWSGHCTVTSGTVSDHGEIMGDAQFGYYASVTATYTGNCEATWYDSDVNEHVSVFPGSWTVDEFWQGTEPVPATELAAGDTYDGWVDGTANVPQAYTAYRYGPTKARTFTRKVVVTKVVNTPVMTRTEWKWIGYGDSLSWVRRVAGSRGTLGYDDGGSFLGTQYSWRNTSGSLTFVWFDAYGRATNFSWYG